MFFWILKYWNYSKYYHLCEALWQEERHVLLALKLERSVPIYLLISEESSGPAYIARNGFKVEETEQQILIMTKKTQKNQEHIETEYCIIEKCCKQKPILLLEICG